MKKICILSSVNIRHMTLISLYTERLKQAGIEFDIIYMDKYGEDEEFPAKNKYVFKNIIKPNEAKIIKVLKYFSFRNFAIPILEKNNYDFIIVWSDNASFIFADYLAKKWEWKYCLNVRDYFHQNNPFVYKRFEKVIHHSAFTTISSDAYKTFLPSYNYVHVHSLNKSILFKSEPRINFRTEQKPIRITFIGYVRFYDMNKKLLTLFKNDPRFELHYYGTHANILKQYASENNINNAYFYDTFPVAETNKFIKNADIINNLYGSGNMSLDYALSIKLYYGIYNKIPILVSPNTHMEKIIIENKIGFVANNIDHTLKDDIYNWYRDLNFEDFSRNCDNLLEEIEEQNAMFNSYFNKYILG
jgi:hypothetical protein